MADIILSTPTYCGVSGETMDRTLLATCLAVLARENRRRIYCHGDWSRSADELQWLLGETDRLGLSASACLLPEELQILAPLLGGGRKIEISLNTTTALDALEKLGGDGQADFFLPLAAPDEHPEVLVAALPFFPGTARVILGVGWSHRLSGPAPLAEQDHPAWARAIAAIIDLLAAHGEKMAGKIKVQFACGLKLCLFERQQLGELATTPVIWPIAMCPQSFAIFPDGEIQPCLRLRLPAPLHITPEVVLAEVAEGVGRWLAPFSGHCYQAENLVCRSQRVKSCATGCLQHNLQGWSR